MKQLKKNQIIELKNFAGKWKLLWHTRSIEGIVLPLKNKWCAFNLGSGRCEYITSKEVKRGAK